ncbi:MAG: IS1 family transposase, partial [Cytophagaceae bacterium]|nr:IS1 family transposase [Cytophagaceae bacterium]
MVETRTCCCCKSSNIVRNGKNSSGHQRYKCKDCGVTRVLDPIQPSRKLDSEEVAQTYKERN